MLGTVREAAASQAPRSGSRKTHPADAILLPAAQLLAQQRGAGAERLELAVGDLAV